MKQVREEFLKALEGANDLKAIEELRIRYLGRKGPVQALMASLRNATPEERPKLGQAINDLKVEIANHLEIAEKTFRQADDKARFENERLDITLPGRPHNCGNQHPVSHMLDQLLQIHSEMGFSVQYGPEIESEFYNFEALNFAEDHPARDMHDTFYVAPGYLLRTHTSNTQIRVMEHTKPPIRIAAPGRCFRNEEITARSHLFFHQVEGLYIDRDVTFGDLMATLKELLQRLFGDVEVRFRPSYFPFVEPGMEVDVSCPPCPACKNSGWLEILGAGMVHPEVLKAGGVDPEEYSGYAWGIGVERLVMLRHKVPDIRLLTDGDLRFLQQFSF